MSINNMVIGEILKAQGIKGEIKVRPLTADINRFSRLKLIYIDNLAYRLQNVRNDGIFVYIFLEGITDRDKAQSLSRKTIEIDRINAVELTEGSYFICDLIGCCVTLDNGEIIGSIQEVNQYGAADVITVKCTDGKIMRFPFLKKLVHNVNIEEKLFCVKKQFLDEVSVYED